MTTFDKYELVLTGHKTGRHHNGYCSDPDDMIDIDESITWTQLVPDKKFIRNCVESNGDIKWEALDSFDSETRLCFGSGHCGCSVKIKTSTGKLVKKNDIRRSFLEDYPSDDALVEPNENRNITPHKPVCKTQSPIQSRIGRNGTHRQRIQQNQSTKLYSKTTEQNLPKFYSESYKARCSRINCKWGQQCKYKNSNERRCFFKH
mgnify:CR=1 FL=1|tara:strand:- start:400 stop:1011 length:612 start_codon:yes stop_codon:yes gene_type:complete